MKLNLKFSKFFLLISLLINPFLEIKLTQLKASTSNLPKENENPIDKELIVNSHTVLNSDQPIKSEYLIGPRDLLFINFVGLEIFSNNYSVNLEGEIFLPEINELKVDGLTLKELEDLLEEKYKNSIYEPSIKASILEYRPVEIYITGAVKRPGLYTFSSIGTDSFKPVSQIKNNVPKPPESSFSTDKIISIPKIYDALRVAKGVTNNADLSKIILIRKNSKSQGGGKIKAKIDLLSLILEGNQDQNIRIYDGDTIFVEKGDLMIKEQILKVNQSNLTPDFITVFITGNVVKSGPFKIKQGATLTQAIASSGGKKFLSGKIQFVRFEDNGNIVKRKFNYDYNAKANTSKNPILMDGDIIFVNRNLLGNTTKIINEVSSPIVGGFGLYKIFAD